LRATLNLSCEFKDIPETVGDWLNNLEQRQMQKIMTSLNEAKSELIENRSANVSLALESVDQTRQLLAEVDQILMNYSSILAGYIKTKADMDSGVGPPPLPEADVIDEIEEGDEEQSTND